MNINSVNHTNDLDEEEVEYYCYGYQISFINIIVSFIAIGIIVNISIIIKSLSS